MAHISERDKSIDGANYFRNHQVGCFGIIRTDELPNLVKVTTDFRMEIIG
jgi:hypothetical protein